MPATDCDELLHLTPAQQRAVELVCAGKHDAATADAVGVHRVTVTRWRLYHPGFRAAVNGRRAELAGAAADRLRSLADKALDAVARTLDGDAPLPAALAVLKAVGLTEPPPVPAPVAPPTNDERLPFLPGCPRDPLDPAALLDELVDAELARRHAEKHHFATDAGRCLLEIMEPDPKLEAADRKAARAAVLKELAGRLNDDLPAVADAATSRVE